MFDWLKRLFEWIRRLLFGTQKPPVDEKPLELPFYMGEMLRTHPDVPVEDLRKGINMVAQMDTKYRIPNVLKNKEIERNDNGDMVLASMKTDIIRAGQKVYVYRWAFRVDSMGLHGNAVRESVWHPDSKQKGLIDIKDFKLE